MESGVPRTASFAITLPHPMVRRPAVASFWPHWRGHRQCARSCKRVDFIGLQRLIRAELQEIGSPLGGFSTECALSATELRVIARLFRPINAVADRDSLK